MNIKKIRKNKKGFTLIEIIVVVVILAVLMAVAVPSVLKYLGEADNAKYMAQARGQVLETQNELAKSYADSTDKSTFIANPTVIVSGEPKVGAPTSDASRKAIIVYSNLPTLAADKKSWSGGTALTTGQSPEMIQSYEISFVDGTKALVRANQDVVIDPR